MNIRGIFSLLIPLPVLYTLTSSFAFITFTDIKIVPFSGVYLNALEMRLFSIFVKQLLSLLHIILGLTSVWRRILFCSANSLNDSIISCDNSLIFNSCIWHVWFPVSIRRKSITSWIRLLSRSVFDLIIWAYFLMNTSLFSWCKIRSHGP